jgi:hypothetical protein
MSRRAKQLTRRERRAQRESRYFCQGPIPFPLGADPERYARGFGLTMDEAYRVEAQGNLLRLLRESTVGVAQGAWAHGSICSNDDAVIYFVRRPRDGAFFLVVGPTSMFERESTIHALLDDLSAVDALPHGAPIRDVESICADSPARSPVDRPALHKASDKGAKVVAA